MIPVKSSTRKIQPAKYAAANESPHGSLIGREESAISLTTSAPSIDSQSDPATDSDSSNDDNDSAPLSHLVTPRRSTASNTSASRSHHPRQISLYSSRSSVLRNSVHPTCVIQPPQNKPANRGNRNTNSDSDDDTPLSNLPSRSPSAAPTNTRASVTSTNQFSDTNSVQSSPSIPSFSLSSLSASKSMTGSAINIGGYMAVGAPAVPPLPVVITSLKNVKELERIKEDRKRVEADSRLEELLRERCGGDGDEDEEGIDKVVTENIDQGVPEIVMQKDDDDDDAPLSMISSASLANHDKYVLSSNGELTETAKYSYAAPGTLLHLAPTLIATDKARRPLDGRHGQPLLSVDVAAKANEDFAKVKNSLAYRKMVESAVEKAGKEREEREREIGGIVKRLLCEKCEGKGFIHPPKGNKPHTTPPTVECKHCRPCATCMSTGLLLDPTSCLDCQSLGYIHPNQPYSCRNPTVGPCAECVSCVSCKGLGTVNRGDVVPGLRTPKLSLVSLTGSMMSMVKSGSRVDIRGSGDGLGGLGKVVISSPITVKKLAGTRRMTGGIMPSMSEFSRTGSQIIERKEDGGLETIGEMRKELPVHDLFTVGELKSLNSSLANSQEETRERKKNSTNASSEKQNQHSEEDVVILKLAQEQEFQSTDTLPRETTSQ